MARSGSLRPLATVVREGLGLLGNNCEQLVRLVKPSRREIGTVDHMAAGQRDLELSKVLTGTFLGLG